MNSEEFSVIFNETIENCRETLFKKAEEYATDDDRLHNFSVASGMLGTNMADALAGMMVKHTTSVYDMATAHDPLTFDDELWLEKIGDHINYLILLLAIISDMREATSPVIDSPKYQTFKVPQLNVDALRTAAVKAVDNHRRMFDA